MVERSGIPFADIAHAADRLVQARLLEEIEPA
jgi:aminopeptidase-like protein